MNRMKSKLNIIEFQNRLKENTKVGSPKFKLTPFAFFTAFDTNSKPFYGLIDDSSFRITINSTFFPTYYVVNGKYKNVNNRLDINYTLLPLSKFHLVWMKYFPILSLVIFNFIFLFVLEKTPIPTYIVFNLFIIGMIIFWKWNTGKKKKDFEQKFIKIFEIIK